MPEEMNIRQTVLRLQIGDITDLPIDAFLYYARPDLKLGSGFGTAIGSRGGMKIQEELKSLGPLDTGGVVVTAAGQMKARLIIHAVGPRFQEEKTEEKLRQTLIHALQAAEDGGIKTLALPAMGAGFYGVPLDLCADVMLSTLRTFLEHPSGLHEVILCVCDRREYQPFHERFMAMKAADEIPPR